ncbi:MAG: hypothetical protein AAFS13_07485 [Pseudomonadota bacterium]
MSHLRPQYEHETEGKNLQWSPPGRKFYADKAAGEAADAKYRAGLDKAGREYKAGLDRAGREYEARKRSFSR